MESVMEEDDMGSVNGGIGGEGKRKGLAEKLAEAFLGAGFRYEVATYTFEDCSYTYDLKPGEFSESVITESFVNDEKVMHFVNKILADPWDVQENENGFFSVTHERVVKCNRMNPCWKIIDYETLDKHFPQIQNTSPYFQVTKVSQSMALPDDIRKLFFVVDSINNAPNLNKGVLPTQRTKLDTGGTKIAKRILHETHDVHTGKNVVENATRMSSFPGSVTVNTQEAMETDDKTFRLDSPRIKTYDSPTYEVTFVHNQLVQFFVSLCPIEYEVAGEQKKAVAWTATAVPLPGTNMVRIISDLKESWSSLIKGRQEVYLKHSDSVVDTWNKLVYAAYSDGKFDIPTNIAAGVRDPDNTNEYHESRVMSPFTFHRKVLNQIVVLEEHKKIEKLNVIGHLRVGDYTDLRKMDKLWEENFIVTQSWYKTFIETHTKTQAFGSFDRSQIPPISFPPTLKYVVRGSGEVESTMIDGDVPHNFQSLLVQSPLIFYHSGNGSMWKPTEYISMGPLRFPDIVDAVLAEWFFDIDQGMFLSDIDKYDGTGVPLLDRNYSSVDNLPFLCSNAYSKNRVAMYTYTSNVLGRLGMNIEQQSQNLDRDIEVDSSGTGEDLPDNGEAGTCDGIDSEGNANYNRELSEFSTCDTISPFHVCRVGIQETSAIAITRMKNYLKAGIAKITADVSDRKFHSEHIEGVFEVMGKFIRTIVPDMKKFRNNFFDKDVGNYAAGVASGVVYSLDGALSHQGGCIALNEYMDQNPPNLTLYRELYTCNGALMGTHSLTWDSYLWTLWVCVLNGLVTRYYGNQAGNKATRDYKFYDKPNAAGIDTAVVRQKHNTVLLIHDTANASVKYGLTDHGMTTSSPHAFETMNAVAVIGTEILALPNRGDHLQLIHMTEFRPTDIQTALDVLVKMLPRSQGTASDGTANDGMRGQTTDVNKSGQREIKNFYHVQRCMFTLISTNKRVSSDSINESIDSLRASVVFTPAGRARQQRGVGGTRTMDEAIMNRGNRNMSFPGSTPVRKKFRTGMALSEVVTKAIFAIHWSGFTSIEVAHEVTALYEWYLYIFNQGFRWLLPTNDATSTFERILKGWKARGVSDTVHHMVIGRMAAIASYNESLPEGVPPKDFWEAVLEIMLTLQHGAHPMYLVPTQFHLALKHMIDPRLIMINHVFRDELNPPVVPFEWLWELLQCGPKGLSEEEKTRRMQEDPDYLTVRAWIQNNITRKRFMPRTAAMNMDYTTNVIPYITSAGNAVGGGIGETLLRKSMEGSSDPLQIFGETVASSTMATEFFSGTGVMAEPDTWKSSFRAYKQLVVKIQACMGGFDIFNIRDVMKLFQIENVPPRFNVSTQDGGKEWGKEMVKQIQVGQDERYLVTGVHFMALIVLSSIFHRDEEEGFHSNMTSNAAANIIRFTASLAPSTVMMGGHKSIHIKTFRFGSSDVALGTSIRNLSNPHIDYFLRSSCDTEPFSHEKMIMLDSMYNNYMFEDTIHMTQILSFMRTHNMKGRHLFAVPVADMNPEYELVPERSYPFVKVDGRELVVGSITMTESSQTESSQSETAKTKALHVSITAGFMQGDGSINVFSGDFSGMEELEQLAVPINTSHLPHELGSRHMIILPLIARRNAVVYNEELGYGVIVQRSVSEDGRAEYFNPETLCYRVYWGQDHGEEELGFVQVDTCLQRTGSFVYVDSSSECVAVIRDRIANKDHKKYYRGNLYYPQNVNSREQSEQDKRKIYVLFDRFMLRYVGDIKGERKGLVLAVEVESVVPNEKIQDKADVLTKFRFKPQRAENVSNRRNTRNVE